LAAQGLGDLRLPDPDKDRRPVRWTGGLRSRSRDASPARELTALPAALSLTTADAPAAETLNEEESLAVSAGTDRVSDDALTHHCPSHQGLGATGMTGAVDTGSIADGVKNGGGKCRAHEVPTH